MVPLNYVLKNGQQVEIVTAKQGGPSRDWLNPELGYVTSHRARTKVRQWFKAQQQDETLAHGRAVVERELARAGATARQPRCGRREGRLRRRPTIFSWPWGASEINTRQLQLAIKARRRSPAAAAPAGRRTTSACCARAGPRARAAAF